MKHSKKTYNSFQDELEDYIKVQKARGLEPKTCFRKMREDYLEAFGYKEEVDFRSRYRMSNQTLPSETVHAYPASYNSPQTLENRLPQRLPAREGRLRRNSAGYCQLTGVCSSEKRGPLDLSQQEYNCGSHSGESGVYKHLSSVNSTGAHQASHKQIHQKRERRPEESRDKPEEDRPKHKKRKGGEGGDSDRHSSIQRKTATEGEAVSVGAEKLKSRKEKKSREVSSKKEERKRKKEKKDKGQARTEEEMLWDQSILGF